MKSMIKAASLQDIPCLRALEQKLIAHERSVESQLIQTGHLEYYDLENLIKNPKAIVLIALNNDEPVGCGFGEIRPDEHFHVSENFGYIGLMFVDESQRGQGLGGQIIQQLTDWFRDQSIFEIRLKVYAKNPGAIAAYERHGFEYFMHEMRLILS